ncbi:MAG TPA: A/G-specific adenine glycosylase, partial [Patescibacteria group bacterium]|nr:A/G-specific adenine glycosylase [Patescibacteria group bacterium]
MSPHLSTSQKRIFFSQALLYWYNVHARDLPWRQTHDPYHILVSELMLQQTQVDRVLLKYTQWFTQFPTIETLAHSQARTVIAAWQGLGYNRRALYLHRIAQAVVQTYNGRFPQTKETLLPLPGIGPYTTGAIMSFAFCADEPIVDTNVKRVVGRVFIGYKKLPQVKELQLWELVKLLLPKKGKTYYFNQALMDFGSLVCTRAQPKCSACPLQNICKSYPAIQTAKKEDLRLPTVKETLYFKKPRRIWRGKI